MSNKESTVLKEFARLFEPLHQSVCKTGGAKFCEYDAIWHYFKDEVRPLVDDITQREKGAGQ